MGAQVLSWYPVDTVEDKLRTEINNEKIHAEYYRITKGSNSDFLIRLFVSEILFKGWCTSSPDTQGVYLHTALCVRLEKAHLSSGFLFHNTHEGQDGGNEIFTEMQTTHEKSIFKILPSRFEKELEM